MNAKRLTVQRVMMTLVLLVSAMLGMAPLPAPRAAHAAPVPPPGSWPFFRYDMQRTNRVPSAVAKGNITQPAIKWTYPVGGGSQAWAHDITGPNGLPDGVPEIIAYGGGRVRAFNSQTGDPIWTSDLLVGLGALPFVGDVDGDGRVEVLAQAYGGTNPNWRVFVLSGVTGQTLSQFGEYAIDPYDVTVADANGDGKMEVFETGYNDVGTHQVFSFLNGASNPQLIAGSISGFVRRPVIADFNGDNAREILLPAEGARYYVMNPSLWTIAITYVVPGVSYYPNVMVGDVLASLPGREILASWTGAAPVQPGYLTLHRVGSAPGYPFTQHWSKSVSSTPAYGSELILLANLDSASDLEILWSYYDSSDNRWETEVVRAADGQTLFSINNRRLCMGGYGGILNAAINLDGDIESEVVLCEVYGQAGSVVRIHTYDWTGSQLAAKWDRVALPASWNELASINAQRSNRRMPNFTADFDQNGVLDVLAFESGALKALRGVDGAPVYTYTPPVNVSVQYLGDLDGNPATPEVVLSGADGYLYYLDRTLNLQRRMYAGAGFTAPYVVDTNGDGRNEVIFINAVGQLLNVDPLTATQQLPPRVNWAWSVGLPRYWHPLNLDNAGLWEYLVVDASQAPTYTLQLKTKDPLSGVENTLGSYTFSNASQWPHLHATGQFNGSGPNDIFVSLGNYPDRPVYMLSWNGSTFGLMWSQSTWSHGSHPAAVGNADGDSDDDLAWQASPPGLVNAVIDGFSGSLLKVNTAEWQSQPILANIDADGALEALYAAHRDGSFRVIEFAPPFTNGFTRIIPGSGGGIAAVADVSLSEPGLEIVYRTQNGVLGTMSGINGSDIYTRGLGVDFVLGTCQSIPSQPRVYPGPQVPFYESACPGAMRLANLNDLVVADIDTDNRDEILAASDNGYLYALNAEDGSLLWAYNFQYPVGAVRVANLDADVQLEVLVSVGDGFLYALDRQTFPRPQSAWDGPSAIINDDIDVQTSRLCYTGHWRATSDPFLGQPEGYRIALRDEGGALMTEGYLNVLHVSGANVMGATLCYNDPNPQRALVSRLVPGRRYYLEVISYKGDNSSAATVTDMVQVVDAGNFEHSRKAATPETTTPGGVITWTIVVRNTGTAPASVEVRDPLPPSTSYVPGSGESSFGPPPVYNAMHNQVEWQSGVPLAVGQAVTVTFATQVDSGLVNGIVRNQAEVIDLDSGARVRVEAVATVGASNLSSAQKTVVPAQANLNSVLNYTIRLTNTGTLTASGMLVEDPLPAGVVYQPGSASSSGGSGAASYDALYNRVLWVGSLGPGESLTVTFAARVNVANSIIDNCATIRDAQSGVLQRCARTVVGSGQSSLVGSLKTSDRLNYAPGDQITYTIKLMNGGTQNAPNVVLRDVLPAGVSLASASASAGVVNYTASEVTWVGAIPAGAMVEVWIWGYVTASGGVVKNTAVVTDAAAGQVHVLTREVLVGSAPSLSGQKFAEPPNVQLGDEITYVLRLENTGNAVAASAVLSDPLPSGTSYVLGSAEANVGAVSYDPVGQRLEWSGPVYLTQTTVITWRVKVEAGVPTGSQIVNRAFAYDGVSDYDEMVAMTTLGVPPGKALIRGYVYSGTGTVAMPGVLLSAAGLVTVSQATNASGHAALLVDALVTPTNYMVYQVAPAGYVNLTPNPVGLPDVVEGGMYDVVFRNAVQAPAGFGWVRGVVFNDANQDGVRNPVSEVGLAGVTVQASTGASMQTLGDGSYFFLLPAGGRVITQTNLTGWQSTTPDVVPVNVASGGAHEVDFGDWRCQGLPVCEPPGQGYAWIYGYVYRDADGVLNGPDGLKTTADDPLVLVDVWANIGMFTGSDGTDASGFYFLQVPAGSGQVTYTLPAGYLGLSPGSVTVNVGVGGNLRVDFAVVSATTCAAGTGIVSGYVYSDTNSDGVFVLGVDKPTLGDATVEHAGQTQQTNWMYAFVCVPAGDGVVTSTNPAGYTNTTPNSVSVTVPDGGLASVNFGKAFQRIPIPLRYAYIPIVMRPPDLSPSVFIPIVIREP